MTLILVKTRQFLCIITLIITSFMEAAEAPSAAEGYQIIPDKSNLKILNPSLANRKSLKIRLNNGLEAYLISDPDADQSAAALNMEAGSWQDPKEYPGMAHFLEHMLFMGTAAYPKEHELMQFVADHGGMINASTSPDHTMYMFSVNNDAFSPALDMLAHFFIDPLLPQHYIDRELLAVDQEHAKNIENDHFRMYMVYKETGNPNHPNAQFSTGNAKTLSGIPQKALKKWFEDFYCASKMHLFVVSALPMEEIVSLVVRDFSAIPGAAKAFSNTSEPMTSSKQLGHMVYIKPIKDLRLLSMTWEVPKEFTTSKEKIALELIAYALQADGENSLIEELKREKLAEKINVSFDRFSIHDSLFSMDIRLTPHGVTQMDTVIKRCFQAIASLKQEGIPKYLFDEFVKMSTFNYEYQSREEPFHYVRKVVDGMPYEDLETYPQKTLQPAQYDPDFLQGFLQTLTPEQCIFFVMADPALTDITPAKSEKWTLSEYTVKEIPHDKLMAWSQSAANPQIQVPQQNPFIPAQLGLKDKSGASPVPSLVADDDGAKIYYMADTRYLIPETSARFNIKTPLIDGTAKKIALTDLFLKALSEKLSSTLFFSDNAGLHASFDEENLKIHIAVTGFSEKTPLLIKEIFDNLKKVNAVPEQFQIYKQSLLSSYDNASKELPVFQARELLTSIIFSDAPTHNEKYKALKLLSYEDFQNFSSELFKRAYIEGFFYGNLTEKEAQELAADLKNTLAAAPYPKDQHQKRQLLILPSKAGPYVLHQQTERQGNGVLLMLEEGPFSFEKRAAQQVLSKALKEPFFEELRTKQQTAYFARAWESEEERELFQYFAVQSSTHQPRDLLARFDLFIEEFIKNLPEQVSQERFESIQKSLVKTLQMPPENLEGMAGRLFTLAFLYDGDFNWYEKRIESVKNLTYEDLKKAAQEFLSRSNSRRLAVLIEGVLHPDNHFQYEAVTKEDIKSIGTYTHTR